MSAVIYRELSDPSPDLVKWLEDRDQLFVVVDPRGVEHSYVDNGTPRDALITEEIVGTGPFVGCTKGFALFSDEGDFIAEYRDVIKAEKALASVKPVVTVEIEGVESENVSWNSVEGSGTDEEHETARG
jgi:hypothetical protein